LPRQSRGAVGALQEVVSEAHVPTEQPQAQEDARVPGPDAHARRAGRAQGATHARPQAARGLIQPIHDRATFDALAQARPARRGPVTVRVLATSGSGPPRVAYAVGRTVGGAVARNRARRRLRAALRDHADVLRPGAAYLVSASREVVSMPFAELTRCLGAALRAGGGSR
jgi:ribonuclease P protein component